jgi:hypothetical protein
LTAACEVGAPQVSGNTACVTVVFEISIQFGYWHHKFQVVVCADYPIKPIFSLGIDRFLIIECSMQLHGGINNSQLHMTEARFIAHTQNADTPLHVVLFFFCSLRRQMIYT